MAGRRHHTIPDFLLRAFASSDRGDECKVWMYRRGSVGVELNTKNVSVERDFYGTKDESDLDDSITTLESEYAPLLNNMLDCQGEVRDERVPRMVAHLSLRTRSLRQSAIALATWMVDTVRQDVVQPQVLKAAVQEKFGKGELTRMIRKELATRGVGRVEIERLLPALLSQMLPVVKEEMDRLVAEGMPEMGRAIQSATKQLPVSMREHSIHALSHAVEGGARRQAYSQLNWFVLHISDTVILGDSVCLFELSEGKRKFRPYHFAEDATERIFLAFAPHRLLVGTKEGVPPIPNIRELNDAYARCSLEFFVSSRHLPDTELADVIGTWAGILGEQEKQAMRAEFRQQPRPGP